MNTHNLKVDFGKHKGELWTRIPLSYLKWLINEIDHEIAKAELERRGRFVPDKLEISPHALDNASLRLRKIWYEEGNKQIGLYTWLYKRAVEALEQNKEAVIDKGIKFVFKFGNYYPVLKTVMARKNKEA